MAPSLSRAFAVVRERPTFCPKASRKGLESTPVPVASRPWDGARKPLAVGQWQVAMVASTRNMKEQSRVALRVDLHMGLALQVLAAAEHPQQGLDNLGGVAYFGRGSLLSAALGPCSSC